MTLKYKQQNIIHTVHDLTFQTFSFHVLIFSLIKGEAEGKLISKYKLYFRFISWLDNIYYYIYSGYLFTRSLDFATLHLD